MNDGLGIHLLNAFEDTLLKLIKQCEAKRVKMDMGARIRQNGFQVAASTRMTQKIASSVFAFLALPCAMGHAAEPIRFLTLENRTMPFGQVEQAADGKSVLVDGIVKDWQDALASALGRPAMLVLLPRKRQDLAIATKQVDLRCFISPDWLAPSQKELYDWPAPFFEVEERLVTVVGGTTVTNLEELANVRIGTVLGYSYRALEPVFSSGRASREDAPNETALLLKQLAGRTDYSVMRTLDFRYLTKNNPKFSRLQLTPAVVSRIPLHCARPTNSSVGLRELENAQERLLKAGTMDRILAKYRE